MFYTNWKKTATEAPVNNLFSLTRNTSKQQKLRAFHSFAETQAAAEVSGEAPDREGIPKGWEAQKWNGKLCFSLGWRSWSLGAEGISFNYQQKIISRSNYDYIDAINIVHMRRQEGSTGLVLANDTLTHHESWETSVLQAGDKSHTKTRWQNQPGFLTHSAS